MNILRFPLARITIWFIAGILLSTYIQIPAVLLIVVSAIVVVGLLLTYNRAKKHRIHALLFGISASALSLLVGITTQQIHAGNYNRHHYIHSVDSSETPHSISVVIREKLKETQRNSRYFANVQYLDGKLADGKILINVRKDSLHKTLQIGAKVFINSRILKHKPPNNPNQFDYGKYLANKSVMAQMYASGNQIKIGETIKKDVWYYSDCLRSRILGNLKKSNFNKTELNILAALLFGQQQDIDRDVLRDYQYAGAVHILSVSGLHVGFILLFLNFALKYLPKTKWNNIFKLTIVIVCLWGFAVIAGLSPSVVRSVTMFSFLAVGMHLRRSTNIYHTLLVSILLILLFQPSFLFDVGFQLSYSAVFFIVWLQPMLSSLWTPKYSVAKYFWDILTVSFAAQIGAFPLSVYYFHQFPGLFFITNLVIIPFLSVIMFLGVVATIIAAFGMVPKFLAISLEKSISILNDIIHQIATFENFIFRDIPFNWQMMTTSYLAIIVIIIYFKKPNFRKLAFAVFAILTFQFSWFETHRQIENEMEWIVFDARRSTLITERSGDVTNSFYSGNEDFPNDLVQSYLTANFTKINSFSEVQNVQSFDNHKILILDSLGIYPDNCCPDVLLLTNSAKINLDRALQSWKPSVIIADGSNYRTYVERWRTTCLQQKIPFHFTGEKGSFKLSAE